MQTLILIFLICLQSVFSMSFSTAKKKLKEEIYPSRQTSVYCGCRYSHVPHASDEQTYADELEEAKERYKLYNWDSLKGFEYPSFEEWSAKMADRYSEVPDLEGCHFEPKGSGYRAGRIEWEHAMPASLFGKNFPEWENGHEQCVTSYRERRICERDSEGEIHCRIKVYEPEPYDGRRCVRKVSDVFSAMEADMHNLYPSVGDVNGYRSNLPFGVISGEAREFGACDFEHNDTLAEPTPSIRGEMARTWLYMAQRYPTTVHLSDAEFQMYEEWSASDPVDAWECERNLKIQAIQGNDNPIVTQQCEERQRILQMFEDLHH